MGSGTEGMQATGRKDLGQTIWAGAEEPREAVVRGDQPLLRSKRESNTKSLQEGLLNRGVR